MKKIKLVCAGAGYFAQYQLEAWTRIPEVDLVALCEKDRMKGQMAQKKYGIPHLYTNFNEKPYFRNMPQAFETSGREYLKTLVVQEAVYESSKSGMPVRVVI